MTEVRVTKEEVKLLNSKYNEAQNEIDILKKNNQNLFLSKQDSEKSLLIIQTELRQTRDRLEEYKQQNNLLGANTKIGKLEEKLNYFELKQSEIKSKDADTNPDLEYNNSR